MKPVITWIVLANTREASVLENRGASKGLVPLAGKCWEAEDVSVPRDRPGVGHSIAGPAVSAVEQTDRKHQSGAVFASEIARELSHNLADKQFDRLVLVAGPLMLGLMRKALNEQVKKTLIGEIAKDLTALSTDALETHLGEIMAI